ncbi:amidohydrolase family protein [Lichenicoccus sp.]|uniref:amidohydrolase family protein n=1 Tax=Lichenicoccus sp. TaxID=2781899 RepID=UPI003D0DDBE4
MTSIDIHHHFYPTSKDNEGRRWSVEMTLDELDRNGITAAIGSLPPVRCTGSDDGCSQARRWNEWATRICLDHPGRLGVFASLPLRDVDAALAEFAYAYDVLHADGIGLPTNDGDTWLSDERFLPLYEEMNRRKAVVFFHPYSTARCLDLGHAYGGDLISPAWLEFPTNTGRTILGLLATGVTRQFKDIRFIFCHGGGIMPALLGRIAGFEGWDTVGPDTLERTFPGGVHAAFARLYFDCAQAYAPEMFALLRRIAPASHLLFGSDYSYFPVAHSVRQLNELGLAEGVHAAVAGGNAAALFPRFDPGSQGKIRSGGNT